MNYDAIMCVIGRSIQWSQSRRAFAHGAPIGTVKTLFFDISFHDFSLLPSLARYAFDILHMTALCIEPAPRARFFSVFVVFVSLLIRTHFVAKKLNGKVDVDNFHVTVFVSITAIVRAMNT